MRTVDADGAYDSATIPRAPRPSTDGARSTMHTLSERSSDRASSDSGQSRGSAPDPGVVTETSHATASRADGAAPRPSVAQGGARVLLLRACTVGPALLLSVGLARLLGTAGFGAYQTAVAWLAVLAVPAGLGVEKLLVQRIAARGTHDGWPEVRGLLVVGFAAVTASALLMTAAGAVLAGFEPELALHGAVWLGLANLPVMVLLRMVAATLQGLGYIVPSQIPELVVVPGVSLLGLAVAWIAFPTDGPLGLTAGTALGILLVAHLIALGLAMGALWRRLPRAELRVRPTYPIRNWCSTAAPMLVIAGLLVLNARTDIVMLGALEDMDEVGPYSAAVRCAGLIAMVLVSANSALAPAVARHHAAGDKAELQRVLTRTARWVAAVGAAGAAVFVAFGDLVLSVFGPEFVAARPALTILALAQLANVAMCAPGLVLMMTGHVKTAAIGLACGAAINALGNWLLIPHYGGTGAALATAAGTLAWTVGLAWVVWQRLGLDTTILGRAR